MSNVNNRKQRISTRDTDPVFIWHRIDTRAMLHPTPLTVFFLNRMSNWSKKIFRWKKEKYFFNQNISATSFSTNCLNIIAAYSLICQWKVLLFRINMSDSLFCWVLFFAKVFYSPVECQLLNLWQRERVCVGGEGCVGVWVRACVCVGVCVCKREREPEMVNN